MPCLAPVALLSPYWAVAPMSRAKRVASLALTGAGVITLLHLIAGARITPVAGALACLPLALAVLSSRLAERAVGAGAELH
jgi:ABC-type thiamine transport system ATPase subunit